MKFDEMSIGFAGSVMSKLYRDAAKIRHKRGVAVGKRARDVIATTPATVTTPAASGAIASRPKGRPRAARLMAERCPALVTSESATSSPTNNEDTNAEVYRTRRSRAILHAGRVLVVGSFLPPTTQKLVMGVSFGGALTMVIFAGSELFTGSNLVLTLGVWTGRATARDLAANWVLTWIGNLLGSVLLAIVVVRSGVVNAEPIKGFVLKVVETKMHIPAEQLIWRATLANWLVCLGVWMAARAKSETARILLIWWCMFTFIACGYEHSVANMCGLMMGLLLPHGEGISALGYFYNLSLATLGNILGGVGFVAGAYWLGSPQARAARSKPVSAPPAGERMPDLLGTPAEWAAID